MRSRHLSCRPADDSTASRIALVVAAVVAVIGSACGGDAPESASGDGFAAPDRVVAGPQGAHGQFVVECSFEGQRPDDPIVHPGQPGASHLHQFFGARDVTATSEWAELLDGGTTCDQAADTASYWTPALIGVGGRPVEPIKAIAYYRAGPDVDPTTVEPYPAGFMVVAGDHTALEPQPTSVAAFGCGSGGDRSTAPTDCDGVPLTMVITFQDCWDGEHVRSPVVPDPDSHVSYSRAGRCPESHPVPVPQLQLVIEYPAVIESELDGLALASGSIHTGHADFWNAWDQDKLVNEVTRCIHLDLVCGVRG